MTRHYVPEVSGRMAVIFRRYDHESPPLEVADRVPIVGWKIEEDSIGQAFAEPVFPYDGGSGESRMAAGLLLEDGSVYDFDQHDIVGSAVEWLVRCSTQLAERAKGNAG